MDDSLTNLMNESQSNEIKYILELNIPEDKRKNIKLCLIFIGFLINFPILFINDIITNVIMYIISLITIVSGISLIYKTNDYVVNNLILFSVYIISIIFDFILIANNSNGINILSLLITMLYQIVYVVNFE